MSAYSGGLWVAALSAACAMAQALQPADDSVAQHYRDLHQSAARVYNESLWNPSVRLSHILDQNLCYN